MKAGQTSTPTCPISLNALRDPVIMVDGHTYERECIDSLRERKGRIAKSPLHNGPLFSDNDTCWATRHMRSLGREWTTRCGITREPYRVPVFYTVDGEVYEREAIMARIECEQRTAAEDFWRQTSFARRMARKAQSGGAFLIPHYALASALGIDMPADLETCEVKVVSPQPPPPPLQALFDAPRVRSLAVINCLSVRNDPMVEESEQRTREALTATGFPVIEIQPFAGFVFFHLDLRGVVLHVAHKGSVFYDCDLRGAIFCADMPRCQFNRCDMRGCVFLGKVDVGRRGGLSAIGEEVAFCDSRMDGAAFAEGFEIEIGETWTCPQSPEQLTAEIRSRGGLWSGPLYTLDVERMRGSNTI